MTADAVTRVVALLRSGELAVRYGSLVDVRPHPDGGLVILNYTRECQYSAAWDDVTLACRGLVVDTRTWEVAARPFAKFFNVGERPETQPDALPAEPFAVFEKLDGSLGISYRGPDGPALASRGAFASDQAQRGTAFLRALPGVGRLDDRLTYLFEIIYSENKSVLRYPFEDIVLLGVIDRATGADLTWPDVAAWGERLGCRLPRVYPFATVADVVAGRTALTADMEGYVVRFASGLRVKIKGEAYLALHKAVWGLTRRHVGEALAKGTYDDLKRTLPEEFWPEVEAFAASYRAAAANAENATRRLFARAPATADRKTFALWVNAEAPKVLRGPLFQLYDRREPDWLVLGERMAEEEES